MTARKPPQMRMNAHVGSDLGSQIAELDSGGALWSPIRATFESDKLRIEIEVEVVDGHPQCSGFSAKRLDGGGLELMTTEVTRGVNLRVLMANACASAALETKDSQGYTSATSVEAVEAVIKTLKRRRSPITDKELRAFARERQGVTGSGQPHRHDHAIGASPSQPAAG